MTKHTIEIEVLPEGWEAVVILTPEERWRDMRKWIQENIKEE